MGLDNYGVYGKDHHKYIDDPNAANNIPDEFFPKNNLCGGMFSGGGNSFRGKVYSSSVEHFTGYSLYDDVLDNETCKEISTMLGDITPEAWQQFTEDGDNTWGIEYKEIQQLSEWFHVVAEEGGQVVSWY